jgi:hypothetical protein
MYLVYSEKSSGELSITVCFIDNNNKHIQKYSFDAIKVFELFSSNFISELIIKNKISFKDFINAIDMSELITYEKNTIKSLLELFDFGSDSEKEMSLKRVSNILGNIKEIYNNKTFSKDELVNYFDERYLDGVKKTNCFWPLIEPCYPIIRNYMNDIEFLCSLNKSCESGDEINPQLLKTLQKKIENPEHFSLLCKLIPELKLLETNDQKSVFDILSIEEYLEYKKISDEYCKNNLYESLYSIDQFFALTIRDLFGYGYIIEKCPICENLYFVKSRKSKSCKSNKCQKKVKKINAQARYENKYYKFSDSTKKHIRDRIDSFKRNIGISKNLLNHLLVAYDYCRFVTERVHKELLNEKSDILSNTQFLEHYENWLKKMDNYFSLDFTMVNANEIICYKFSETKIEKVKIKTILKKKDFKKFTNYYYDEEYDLVEEKEYDDYY